MQLSNKLSVAVALVASSVVALPVQYPTFGADSSGAGAAGSQCSSAEEGRVVCSNGHFQVCASGTWSTSMSLSQGTDCSVFGTPAAGGNGTLPQSPETIAVSPIESPTGVVEPEIPTPTAEPTLDEAPVQYPTPTSEASEITSSEEIDSGEPTGFVGQQIYSDTPAANVPTQLPQPPTQPVQPIEPAQPTQPPTQTQSQPQPTGQPGTGGSTGGSTTPKPFEEFHGSSANFPGPDQWLDFESMWSLNSDVCEGPQNMIDGENKGPAIKQAILQVADESGLDPRIIFAVVLQESTCLLSAGTTNGGVNNPGIMQSHNGVSFDPSNADASITRMVRDGVVGTDSGMGLVGFIDEMNGDLYNGLRAYNSGENGVDLNDLWSLPAGTGTASYCNDIANRLTGGDIESQ